MTDVKQTPWKARMNHNADAQRRHFVAAPSTDATR